MSDSASSGGVGLIPAVTAVERLERLGLSWEQLERLARRALRDAMRDCGSTLDEERREAAVEYLFDVGIEWAARFDPAQANGVSFATSAFRRMKMRYEQFLRDAPRLGFHGTCDTRRGQPLMVAAVSVLPDGPTIDRETFEQLVESVSHGLSSRALWTLTHLTGAIAVDGLTLADAAGRARVEVAYAEELLEELGWQLGHEAPRVEPERQGDLDSLFTAWRVAA